jgi:hypothetical protein
MAYMLSISLSKYSIIRLNQTFRKTSRHEDIKAKSDKLNFAKSKMAAAAKYLKIETSTVSSDHITSQLP